MLYAGTSTSALGSGGYKQGTGGGTGETELWNGTNWTEVADLNTARSGAGSFGADNTSVLAFGGYAPPGDQAVVEDWNGASWVEVADLSSGRQRPGGAGTTTAGLSFGGGTNPGTSLTATEEWSVPSNVIKVLTD